jgi:hypothetical protein
MTYTGSCHCGAIGYTFDSAVPPARWSVRACQCSFCRAHGALSVSDPRGSVRFHTRAAGKLVRYRFGLRTADFLLCRECGVYIGAVMSADGKSFAIVNVNTLSPLPELPESVPMNYDGESGPERLARRAARWTPVEGAI